jgi:hypothetical protein
MERLKVVIAVLFPALWILGAGPHRIEQTEMGYASGSSVIRYTCEWGKQKSPFAQFSFEFSARLTKRRVTSHRGLASTALSHASLDASVRELMAIGVACPGTETPIDLAKSWQFRFRTAQEPRSPSSLS